MNRLSPKLESIRELVARGKSLGLIHSPGERRNAETVSFPAADAEGIKNIKVSFVQVSPMLAQQYLERNTSNRKMRESVVLSYLRDIQNGDWLLNHQGIAFDEAGTLIDGQHRLEAIARSRKCVTLLVSTGWPTRVASSRNTTMDTVDRGLNRTIADQLGLQHGITDARYAAGYATVIAKLCLGSSKSIKMTTGLALGVMEHFRDGLKFAVEHRNNLQGLRTVGTIGAMAFAYAVHPKRVAAFNEALVSGSGLTKTNPILHVRNWLTVGEGAKYITGSYHFYQASVVLNHIQRWVEGKTAEQICTSQEGWTFFCDKQEVKVAFVKSLFQHPG